MPFFASAKLVFNSLRVPVSFRSLSSPFKFRSSFSTTTRINKSHDDFFNYTSGRWVYNEALRLAERKHVFDVEELRRLAAQSVGRSSADIVSFTKLDERGFSRTFLITLRDNFQMVARIPFPFTVPKYYGVASEVATMDFLRSSGLPVPQVYGYSPVSDNAAKTEYIFTEFVKGKRLADVWPSFGPSDFDSIMRQLVRLESKMMSIPFPAGGSLYYTHDLENVVGQKRAATLLKDKRFCVGPDTSIPLWYGKRSQLNVDRGPYKNSEAVLVAAAKKELAYLEQFGQPLLPFRRERRGGYDNQEQSPSAHAENLKRYLAIAPSLVPKDPVLEHFCIRHPDLHPAYIIVQRSDDDSGWKVVSLLDWRHTAILPLFLQARIPQIIRDFGDPAAQSMPVPPLPNGPTNELDDHKGLIAEELYSYRLAHHFYVKNTEKYNKPHYDAMTGYTFALRSRPFTFSRNTWQGEPLELKIALIDVMEMWKSLVGGTVLCPLVAAFDAEDIRKAKEVDERQSKMDHIFGSVCNAIGLGEQGFVSTQDYEKIMASCMQVKERALGEDISDEERAEILEHWPWDDMDEEKYD